MRALDDHEAAVQQPCLHWHDLRLAGAAPTAPGWSKTLSQGLILLLDASGDAAAPWLPVLAGRVPALSGQLHCGGVDSRHLQAYAAQVFWQNPREPLARREQLVSEWVAQTAQRWPLWDEAAWQRHVQGFVLKPQLGKPLWHLSTGSLRKLWMAAALASGAKLTVIDEPTAGLDGTALRYLQQALDALGAQLADAEAEDAAEVPPRWVLVAHWEALSDVTWDALVELPDPVG